MSDELPAEYDFEGGVYRGDDRVWTHAFNDDPLPWEPATTYLLGDRLHGPSEVYVPNTTVTVAGVPYTCIAAHTSGDDFDPAMWVVDEQALGPETDISAWVFLAQYRASTSSTAAVLATDDFDLVTDGTDGRVKRTLTHTQAALLTSSKVGWDLQVTKGDGTVKTLLFADHVPVLGDFSRVVGP